MNRSRVLMMGLFVALFVIMASYAAAGPDREGSTAISLPSPETSGGIPLAWTLQNRQATKDFLPGSIKLQHLAQLLWAAQGETDSSSARRTAPSFNNLYPLSVYVLAGEVTQLSQGFYKYLPKEHVLTRISLDDWRDPLARSLREQWIADAPIVLIFTGNYDLAARRLGKSGARYVDIELGHVVQNLYLQATALHVGAIFFTTFDNKKIIELLTFPSQELPVGIMPVGRIP